MKVRFLKSPVGMFNLAYVAGEEAIVSEVLAEQMIELGYAVETENQIEKAIVSEIETPEKPKKKK